MPETEMIISCKSVQKDICENRQLILDALIESAKLVGAKVLAASSFRAGIDTPPGVICFVMIDESFIYCHSYSEKGTMAIRVYTCGKADPEKAWL